MKTLLKYSLALLAGLSVALSCSKIGIVDTDNGETADSAGKQIIIHATLADAPTRVEYTLDESGEKPKLTLKWESTDALLVSNASGSVEIGNPTIDATGKTATFSGTLPEGGEPYTVVVKHAGANLGATQTQAADGDLKHLEYAAMAEGVTEADFENLALTQTTGVLGLIAKIPTVVSAAVKAVIFQTESTLFNGSNTLTVNLTQGGAGVDNILYVYANVAAASIPAGTEMFIRFKVGDGENDYYTRYQKFEGAVSLTTGALNGLKLNCTHIDRYAGKDDKGTAAAPYLIADKYQMDAVDDLLKADETVYFRMVDDVDMSGITWVPLNNKADDNGHFSKYISFDGDSHTLSNITTNATKIPAYPSVFGVLNGKVANLNIDHATITPGENKAGVLAGYIGSSDSNVVPEVFNVHITNSTVGTEAARGTNYLGGVAAQIQKDGTKLSHVTIESSTVYGNLAENKTIGGMIAYIKCGATLEDCHSSALVHARAYVGGIVGFTEEPEGKTTLISRCYADGAPITATYRYAGGIVGHANGSGTLTISDCYVSANVSATKGWAGGICGDHNKGVTQISNCYSTGEVSASFGAGGIVGQVNADGLDVKKCAVFNAAIKATLTDNDPHYSSGAVVAYAKGKKMTINTTYHKAGMSFTECPGNSGNTLPTSNSGISWLNDLEVAQGAHENIYPYHGRRTTMTLVALTQNTYGWDANVWDFTGDVPTLK